MISISDNTATHCVLDTNIWLDVLVFENPDALALYAALQQVNVQAVLDDETLGELQHQLLRISACDMTSAARRERAALAAEKLADIRETLHAVTQNKAKLTYTIISIKPWVSVNKRYFNTSGESICLPKCRDKNDQMFITLASQVNARWLITHDKALIKCRRYRLHNAPDAATGLILTPNKALELLRNTQH